MIKKMDKKSAMGILSQGQPKSSGLPENYEQQIKDFYASGLMILHSKGTRRQITEKVIPKAIERAGAAPKMEPAVISAVTLWVIDHIESRIKGAKKQANPLVVAAAGPKIAEAVANLATQAKLMEPSEDDIIVAVGDGTQKYLTKAKADGRITDKELSQGVQDMEKEHPEALEAFQATMDRYRKETGQAKSVSLPGPNQSRQAQQPAPQQTLQPGGPTI